MPGHRRLSDDERELAVKLYVEGATTRDLRQRFQIGDLQLSRVLRAAGVTRKAGWQHAVTPKGPYGRPYGLLGVPRPDIRKVDGADREAMIARYIAGESPEALGREYGITGTAIVKAARRSGADLSNRPGPRQRAAYQRALTRLAELHANELAQLVAEELGDV